MKKIFLLLTVLGFLNVSNAQTIDMATGTDTVNCVTGGTLYDSGSNIASYSDNENFIMTICPGSPGFGVFVDMISMNIADGDILNIYNGSSVLDSLFPDMPLDVNTIYAPGAQFQATVGNPTGCLTFEFISNGDGVVGDFEFNLFCNARCQTVISSIVNTIPDTTLTPTDVYLDVCLGDTVYVNALNSYPENNTEYYQDDTSSNFYWYWDLSTAQIDSGISQSHYYGNPGGYVARMISYDVNGCRNFQDQIFKVRVAPDPQFVDLEDTVMCLGTLDTLTALPQGAIINGQIVQGDTVYFVPPFYSGDSTFLPDGNGAVYTSDAQLTGFDLNDTIEDCGDILELCVTMEHSYLGDLGIELICPNGQSVTLKAYPGGGGTYLGNPWDGAQQANGAGGGLQYCFSDASANGLLVNGPTQAATNTAGNTIVPNTYQPVDPFTNLVGCPINGLWQLEFTDNLTIDDGYIFNWSLDIAPCMYPEVDSFVMYYDFGYWDSAPSINGIIVDSNTIEIEPDTAGPFQYIYHTTNQFGCEYSHTYNITVEDFDVNMVPQDTTVCAGDPVPLTTTVVGNSGPFTYNWTPSTDLNFSNIANPISTPSSSSIEYIVEATSPNGCTFADTNNVRTETLFEFSAWGDTVICAGDSVNLFTSGGALSYIWTPNNGTISDTSSASPIVSPTTTTTYTVQADSTGCSQFANITVAVSNINVVLTINTDATNGLNNGQIFVIATGGSGPLSYTLNGGTPQGTGIFPGLYGGTYTVQISDTSNCPIDTVIVIAGGPPLIIDSVYTENSLCSSSDNGQIQIFMNDTTVPLTYTLDVGPISQSSNTFNGLSGGTYNVNISDGIGGSADTVIVINQPDTFSLSSNVTDLSCYNSNDGIINVTATGGTLPLTYSIDGVNYQNNGIFDTLNSGTYTIYLLDSNNCLDSTTVNLSEPDSLSIVNIDVDSAICSGLNGAITFDGFGGTTPYQYSIDAVPSFGPVNVFNEAAGSYSLQVMDSNSCISNIILDTIFEPDPLVITTDSLINSNCNSADGEIFVSVSGGTINYSYSWHDGISVVSTTEDLNLFVAGSYTLTVTDDNSCTSSVLSQINDNSGVNLVLFSADSVSCFGADDASIQVSAVGGVAPYSFVIDAGLPQSDSLFTALSGGTHNISVTDANGCISNLTHFTFEPTPINSTVNAVNLNCDQSADGQITINSLGGLSPLTYAINTYNPTQVSNVFSGLDAGTHIAYVIDGNGCSDTISNIVLTQPDTLIINAVVSQDISCNGLMDGSLTITAMGGTLPYEYNINGGVNQSSNVFNILSAGNYTINVTDSNICPVVIYLDTLEEPAAVTFVIDSSKDITCNNGNDGYFSILVSGGLPPFTYSSDNGVTFQGSNIFDLQTSGTYNIIVKDVNNCPSTVQVLNLIEPNALSFNVNTVDADCFGNNSGSLELVSVSGGNTPYTVSFNGATSVPYAAGMLFGSLLGDSTYTIEIIDDLGCSLQLPFFVDQPSSLVFNEDLIIDVACSGDSNGSITVSATGGSSPYQFDINVNGVISSINGNSATFNNLIGGVYPITVTDDNLCSQNFVSTVNVPNALLIDSIVILKEISCFGEDDAAIVVYPSGGFPFTSGEPYTYLWSPTGDTEHKISGLSPGIHTVVVTDANGCTATASQTIQAVDPLIAVVTPDSANISMGDTVQLGVNVTNAIGSNLQYSWSPSTGLSCTDCENPIVTVYNDIEYSVVVTDSNGCVNINYTEVFVIVDNSTFFFIPNSFTPNGDGLNDNFQVFGQDIKSVDLMVFNRWGEKVFEGSNQFSVWDGRFKGVDQSNGIFSYVADIKFLNDFEVRKKGSVSLIK